MIVTGMVLAAQMSSTLAEEAKAADAQPAAEAAEAKVEAKKADVTFVVTGNDTMKFDKEALTVKEGQTVAITFKNVGKVPKIAMGHNLVVLKTGTEPMAFAAAGMAQKDTTGLPTDEEMLKAVIAATKVLGPDEEETITFTAPAAGAYPYICTFPGHAALMKGVLTVEAK